jgi:hypothetical protein
MILPNPGNAKPLRLGEARSGARLCEPQQRANLKMLGSISHAF